MAAICPAAVWLDPVPGRYWSCTGSIQIVREPMQDRTDPLTLPGPATRCGR